MQPMLRYLSLFLMAQCYCGFICFVAWASGTFPSPPAKRAVGLGMFARIRSFYPSALPVALMNSVSSLGNVFGSYFWPVEFGPSYATSYMICIFFTIIGGVLCLIFRTKLRRLNEMAEHSERERGEPKGFRYLL